MASHVPVRWAMNWRLIFMLSIFGLTMAVATVYVVPPSVEPFLWLAIFAVCAFFIARSGAKRPFLHGLLVSIVNSVWITTAHVALADDYLARHPQEAAMAASMSSPRLMMVVTGPIVGVVSGLILGLFAWVASKFVKPAAR
jgi:hypothetical protein